MATHSDISFPEHVALRSRCVDHVDHRPHADVELAVIQKQRFLDVLLQHKDVAFHILVDVYQLCLVHELVLACNCAGRQNGFFDLL